MKEKELKMFLDAKVDLYNQPLFIKDDPISIPHQFSKQQDIEIAGFFAAIFSWGNRTTIINKSNELMRLMDNEPYNFCLHHSSKDLQKLFTFKHRTFNADDLLCFIESLARHYATNNSLETAFFPKNKMTVLEGLVHFKNYFFQTPHLRRTEKHISSPIQNSTCKRLNMYLRWMVRKDNCGVDFGIWKNVSAAQLICPIDVHVARVARYFNLITRKQTDWQTAIELTNALKELNNEDPVKYDYALFCLGVIEKYH